jgi:nicotinate phosphoribosyltransferase
LPEEEARVIRLDNNRQSRKAVPKATQPWQANAAERQRLDELLDEGLKQTFPASDPVAIVQQAPERPNDRGERTVREPWR